MRSSLKVARKTKLTFLLSESLILFLEQKYILFSETYFFKLYKYLAETEDIDMSWQKPQMFHW